jgi:hypothetical protein
MNRSLSISKRSRSNKAARTVFHGGVNERRIAFSGRGAPSSGFAIALFFRRGASCVKEQTLDCGFSTVFLAACEPGLKK